MSLITESLTPLARERVKLSHDTEHYSWDWEVGWAVDFEFYSPQERKVFRESFFQTSNGNSL